MMLPNLHATPLRLVLTYMTVFALSVLLLSGITYTSVQQGLEDQLRLHIATEVEQLMIDYEEDGLDELRHDIAEGIEGKSPQRMFYTLVSPDGRMIFDRLGAIPAQDGWHYTKDARGQRLVVNKISLKDGYQLVVGDDLTSLSALQVSLRNNFIIALVAMLALGTLGGMFISRRFISTIRLFEKTTRKVGRGDLSERLPTSASEGIFGDLATTINAMLERIEHLVGNMKQVASNIAHDMRTPLGHIRLRLEELEKSLAHQPAEQKYCRETIAMLDHSLEIFSSIVRIAQIESGARRAGFVRFDLSQKVSEVVEAYKPVLDDRGIVTEIAITPGLFLVGDAMLLSQAVVNLVENAVMHATGANRLGIALERDGNKIVLKVQDNGIGVVEEKIPHLTRAFFRSDESRSSPGNGLGLNLVSAIVQLHEGRLSFANANPGLFVQIDFPTT